MAALKLDPGARLVEVPSKQPGIRWPIPVDARLDGLVGAANAAGAATTRQELVAALVLTAPTGSEKLRNAIVRFRTATVSDADMGSEGGEYVLRKPGRPRGTRS